MADRKKNRRSIDSKKFGLLLGAVVLAVFTLLGLIPDFFSRPESKVLDAHFRIKAALSSINLPSRQAGVTRKIKSGRFSDDIVLIGVDNRTLEDYGRWPFPRSSHGDVLDTMSKISDQNFRESAVLMDFLFFTPTDRAFEDVMLLDSIADNGNVILQVQLHEVAQDSTVGEKGPERMALLMDRLGEIENISGDTSRMARWYGVEAPLPPYSRLIEAYGYATFTAERDDVYRRLSLLSIYSEPVRDISIDELESGNDYDTGGRGHISFVDTGGRQSGVYELPLTEDRLESLLKDFRRIGKIAGGEGEELSLVTVYQDHFLPSTALVLALEYFNRELSDVEVVPGSHILIPQPMIRDPETGKLIGYDVPVGFGGRRGVRDIDEIRIPIDARGNMLINYMGTRSYTNFRDEQTFQARSYTAVADQAPADDEWPRTKGWDNSVVMIGAFTQAMADDEKATPLGMMFGVEMQANALNTIIMDNGIHTAPFWANLIVMIIMVGLITSAISRFRKIGLAGLVLAVVILVSYAIVCAIFSVNNLLFDWFNPAMASLTAFLVIVIFRVLSAERERRQIQNVFGQFVSPVIAEELSNTHEMPELGGEERDVTVFFSDIRSFSSISEKLNDSVKLVTLLNEYLHPMTDDIVVNGSGTLDKYIGDAIMAFWGAPKEMEPEEHAILACKSALRQMKILEGRVNSWIKERISIDPGYPVDRLDIGIGIHSGPATIGYMGSEGRKNYTAMGDTVNLSSRLEGVNKAYGTRIIISSETKKRIASEPFVLRELDTIRVMGRFNEETIYELVGYDGEL